MAKDKERRRQMSEDLREQDKGPGRVNVLRDSVWWSSAACCELLFPSEWRERYERRQLPERDGTDKKAKPAIRLWGDT